MTRDAIELFEYHPDIFPVFFAEIAEVFLPEKVLFSVEFVVVNLAPDAVKRFLELFYQKVIARRCGFLICLVRCVHVIAQLVNLGIVIVLDCLFVLCAVSAPPPNAEEKPPDA